jgi:serine/threonine protein phosphatase 1
LNAVLPIASRKYRLDQYVRRLRGLFSWLLPEIERSHKYPPAPDGVVIYAIGDIHGRADLLKILGAQIDRDADKECPKEVIEIYLGDYIDRGPDSPSVIDWLLERQKGRNVLFLRGNHELVLEEFLAHESEFKDWRQIGGYETLVSYGVDPFLLQGTFDDAEIQNELASLLPPDHRRFLDGLATAVDLGAYFFVHAGVRPGTSLDGQSEKDCLWIRDEFLDHEEEFGLVVVHGHSPVSTPEFLPNRINLDTAAYATGRLSCLKISEHGARLLERDGS